METVFIIDKVLDSISYNKGITNNIRRMISYDICKCKIQNGKFKGLNCVHKRKKGLYCGYHKRFNQQDKHIKFLIDKLREFPLFPYNHLLPDVYRNYKIHDRVANICFKLKDVINNFQLYNGLITKQMKSDFKNLLTIISRKFDYGDVLVWDPKKGRNIIEPKPYLTYIIRNSRLVKNILNIARSLNLISPLFHDGFIIRFDYYIKKFYISWIENDLPAPALL